MRALDQPFQTIVVGCNPGCKLHKPFISFSALRFGFNANGDWTSGDGIDCCLIKAPNITLSDIELCAIGTFWKAIGDAMSISYDQMPSSKTGWRNGLHWLKEMEQWTLHYEKEAVPPAESNVRLSHSSIDVLLYIFPFKSVKRAGKLVYSCLMSNQPRHAVDFPKPSAFTRRLVFGTLEVRKFFLRHFCLPRFGPFRRRWINAQPNPATGRYNMIEYTGFPWYVEPSISRRWGIKAWFVWFAQAKLPGDDGERFIPKGYQTLEVRPLNLQGKGGDEMRQDMEVLNGTFRFAKCPFSMKT